MTAQGDAWAFTWSMDMQRIWQHLVATVVAVLIPATCLGAPAPACPSGNLLSMDRVADSRGVVGEQRLVDGKAPPASTRVGQGIASMFLSTDARVTFDLGGATRITALQVVTNNNDADLVSLSLDGVSFSPVPLPSSPGAPGGFETRETADLDLVGRYLKIQPTSADGGGSVAELSAFCITPEPFPVSPQPEGSAFEKAARASRIRNAVGWLKVILALGVITLAVLMHRSSARKKSVLALCFLIVGTAGWVRFGNLPAGHLVHPWDSMHNYLGAKYFDELGHTEIYRCIAAHERQQGRGPMVDRVVVRNLDDYTIHPGTWTNTPGGACRARFSEDRWREFGLDVDRYRWVFEGQHFYWVLSDRGYNATPLYTAVVRPVVDAVPVDRPWLSLLAGLDLVAMVVAIGALYWAFGPMAAGVAAVVAGMGNWEWMTGSIGRTFWLAALCVAVALLRRRKMLAGAALVTLSALLRLFPAIFVGALLAYVLARPFTHRRIDASALRVLAGIALAVVLGGTVTVVALDPASLVSFWENTRLLGSVRPGDHLGLGVLASWGLDAHLLRSAHTLGWGATLGRLGIWTLGLAAATAFLLFCAFRRRPAWELVAVAGAVVACAVPLLVYDYSWMLILAPLAAGSRLRVGLLVGWVAAGTALHQVFGDPQLAWSSLLLCLSLLGFFASWYREWSADAPAEQAPSPAHLGRDAPLR